MVKNGAKLTIQTFKVGLYFQERIDLLVDSFTELLAKHLIICIGLDFSGTSHTLLAESYSMPPERFAFSQREIKLSESRITSATSLNWPKPKPSLHFFLKFLAQAQREKVTSNILRLQR